MKPATFSQPHFQSPSKRLTSLVSFRLCSWPPLVVFHVPLQLSCANSDSKPRRYNMELLTRKSQHLPQSFLRDSSFLLISPVSLISSFMPTYLSFVALICIAFPFFFVLTRFTTASLFSIVFEHYFQFFFFCNIIRSRVASSKKLLFFSYLVLQMMCCQIRVSDQSVGY